jgi:hypothetical protein
MNPRPPYRWKSLWLGLFVLVFLTWAWLHSRDRMAGIAVGTPAGSGGLMQYSGEVCIYDLKRKHMWGRTIFNLPAPRNDPLAKTTWQRLTQLGIIIPHWTLMLTVTGIWTAFLGWRWRRLKCLSEPGWRPSGR